ncbi:MAG TPA: hypothetical protein VGO00_11540 [Kofleriaceae bacterium]|jgi:hypothetical protein|nr:hypothetical protein [Kofleriaceae bacterium]
MQSETPNADKSGWTELRRLADELEVQIHLGSMEARDRWAAFQPRLDEVEKAIASSEQKLHDYLEPKIAKLTDAFHKLCDEINATKAPHQPW